MGETILIVDDITAIKEFMKDILKTHDPYCKVLYANDGREACQKASSHLPDLIIMDMEMPKMNGIEALIRLKRLPETKDIPVIICSALTDPRSLKSAMEYGAMDFIKKPILEYELVTRVHASLTLSKTLKQFKKQKEELFKEKQRSESILQALLPDTIIKDLKKTGYSIPKRYQNVAVIFIDLVDFTEKTNSMSPRRLIKELNELYTSFDRIMRLNKCTRIKTIGDAYLAACGMPDSLRSPISHAAKAAMQIRNYIIHRNSMNPIKWEMRIGIYYGDVIGSLVSLSNFTYDIFGNTVNMAARYQTICDPMQINISKDVKEVLEKEYKIVERLTRFVKGQGKMPMYYLHHPLVMANDSKQKDRHMNIPILSV